MNTDVQKRFLELSKRAEERCFTVYSDFLNIDEQSELLLLNIKNAFLFGGFDMAERKIASFGKNQVDEVFPLSVVKIEPLSKKFSEPLSHRDFLGSLIGLGIKREVLGDIVIENDIGYLICLNSISNFIVSELKKVRHTSVKCEVVSSLPKGAIKEPESSEIIVSSIRIDVLISGVYNLSRNDCNKLFLQKKVFVNGKVIENNSFVPNENSLISVRGFGRFNFVKIKKETKKSRFVVEVKIYK